MHYMLWLPLPRADGLLGKVQRVGVPISEAMTPQVYPRNSFGGL